MTPSRCGTIRNAVFSIAPVVAALVLLGASTMARAEPIETQARHALLMDADTGAVLFDKAADERMAPASMSKIMTAYMVFDRLKKGSLKLEDKLPVSENAWRKGGAASGGSTMFLDLGSSVSVDDLLKGIIIQSGNDACIVVAEALAGSENAFAEQMTKRARELGLTNSTFRNASGLPDPDHMMTAHDLATLAKRTIEDFPEYYHYYSDKEFVYNGIRQGNRNPLLYKDFGADGLKTGHTEASGYGLTASAKQGDRRLILVLNGLPSMKSRIDESERFMSWGFRTYNNYLLVKAGESLAEAEVWLGEAPTVRLVPEKDLIVTLPRTARPEMRVVVRYEGPVPAPIQKGTPIATAVISAPNVPDREVPLLAGETVEELGFFRQIAAAVSHVFTGHP